MAPLCRSAPEQRGDVAVRRRRKGEGSVFRAAQRRWRAALSRRNDAGKLIRRDASAGGKEEAWTALARLRLQSADTPDDVTLGNWVAHWEEHILPGLPISIHIKTDYSERLPRFAALRRGPRRRDALRRRRAQESGDRLCARADQEGAGRASAGAAGQCVPPRDERGAGASGVAAIAAAAYAWSAETLIAGRPDLERRDRAGGYELVDGRAMHAQHAGGGRGGRRGG